MIKVLVTGANGQLGQELQQISPAYDRLKFIFFSRDELPIDDANRVAYTFEKIQPQYCINCAAYTAVDKAEEEREAAFRINATAVGTLARISKENNCHFIHFSTDYVFDGASLLPYKPDDPTNPQGVYGASKLEGERLAIKENAGSLIIRTSWVYSEFGKNFVKTMIRLMKEKESINVVDDQVGSPTYAADLADAILQIIDEEKLLPGIYHYSNEGIISWYEFATAIRDLINSACDVRPINSSQYPTAAKRPAYSVLDKTTFTESFDIKLQPWRKSLEICLGKLQ